MTAGQKKVEGEGGFPRGKVSKGKGSPVSDKKTTNLHGIPTKHTQKICGYFFWRIFVKVVVVIFETFFGGI